MGYLSKFVPTIAALVRINEDQESFRRKKIDGITAEFYTYLIRKYKNSLMTKKTNHVFRNSEGKIIKTLMGKELKILAKEITTYRLFNTMYFSYKDPVNNFGKKIEFKIKRFFARIIRSILLFFPSPKEPI